MHEPKARPGNSATILIPWKLQWTWLNQDQPTHRRSHTMEQPSTNSSPSTTTPSTSTSQTRIKTSETSDLNGQPYLPIMEAKMPTTRTPRQVMPIRDGV
ncbi:UNVERIFIED_CONTAM: hypothetical protein FKN15_056435 [Acipenser sinensis]